jgi:DNA polymerase-3 subunit gamma/tau
VSLALARKYRPASFDDLIGQESVSQTLSLALENNRLSHAYLFSGLRGSGKTSTARIFAKALLCEKGPSSHPCGTCTHCVMAAENRHMDIIEMDAASNRGIDDIKELIEHTKYKPSSARYKIFIIDEVHMLTTQAFNALLKTLEEPPDFVKFILATTDPLKLPATILSRTQHFRFKKIPHNLVVSHLEHILNLEGISYEKEALDILARSGAGSLRDSLTLLDQAIVYSKNHVDVATVTGMLGIIEPSLLSKLLQDILQKNTDGILGFIKLAADYEAEMILDELTLYLKDLLLSGDTTCSPMIIERFFRIIADSKGLLSLGSDGEFVLSLTLFKMVEALEIREIDAMIKGLQKELQGVEVNEVMVSTAPVSEVVTITEEEIPEVGIESLALSVQKEESKEQQADSNAQAAKSSAQQAENRKQETTPGSSESPKEESLDTTEPAIQNGSTQAANPQNKTLQSLQETTDDTSPPNAQRLTPNAHKFQELVAKIYDRDHDLGSCFEHNITFVSFEEHRLTWESTAEEADKKMLIKHWGIINMFVKEIFGFETKIENIAKKKLKTDSSKQLADSQKSASSDSSANLSDTTPHTDADTGSMIEEVEMKSSCIAPDAGDTEAAKEKDPSTLLEEPMVKTALELLNPKKVRIKRKT